MASELRKLADELDSSAPAGFWKAIANSVKAFAKAAFRRLLIWLLSLNVAFYVPLHEFGVPYFVPDWCRKVIEAGKTTDVFLAVVAMVILSATDLLDMLLGANQRRLDAVTKGSAGVLLALYFLFIFFEMGGLGGGGVAVAGVSPSPHWTIFVLMLGLGVAGELLIAKTAG